MVIFFPRRFLDAMESVVTFLGFRSTDVFGSADRSELPPFVEARRNVALVVVVGLLIRKRSGFEDDGQSRVQMSISGRCVDDRKPRHCRLCPLGDRDRRVYNPLE